jgi:hypothetical protein
MAMLSNSICNIPYTKVDSVNLNGTKSSLGLYDCKKPPILDSSNEVIYKVDREPALCTNKPQYEWLNKDVNYSLEKNTCYCNAKTCPGGNACKGSYTNLHDGRFRSITGQQLYLGDRPYDANHNTDWWNYPPKLNDNFNVNQYSDYEHVNKGNQLYKVDRNLAVPFNDPLFTMRGNVYHTLQSTPMGKVYSRYHLDIDNKTMNNYSVLNQLNDESFFRESLISTYATPNQTDYARRYYS